MPLFDYKCSSCGEVQEHLVSNSEVKEVECTKCHGIAKQQLSVAAPIFSGGGWFRDGYIK